MTAIEYFEGYEKRLEISFSFSDNNHTNKNNNLGLRALTRTQIESFLSPAGCAIVASLSGRDIDSYVLSESSLFISSLNIVIKTCGATRLLAAVAPILRLAAEIMLDVVGVRYSRGSFLCPDSQPAPHRSFAEEVVVLNELFSGINGIGPPRAFVLGGRGDPTRRWHVYSATRMIARATTPQSSPDIVGIEVCMTGLSKDKASVFYNKTGKEMTRISMIGSIQPNHTLCDHGFDPCGYSMNGIEYSGGLSYSTVHVTPEEGFSYASYEASGLLATKLDDVVSKAVACFNPKRFSVAITCGSTTNTRVKADVAALAGYMCDDVVLQDLPGGRSVVFCTYRAVSKGKRNISQRNKIWEGCDEFVVARACL